jgi:hypothetical protein
VLLLLWCARRGGGLTLLVRWRKPFFYFMPGYPGASRAFAIRKLLIAAACDTRIRVSQAGRPPAPLAAWCTLYALHIYGNSYRHLYSSLQDLPRYAT